MTVFYVLALIYKYKGNNQKLQNREAIYIMNHIATWRNSWSTDYHSDCIEQQKQSSSQSVIAAFLTLVCYSVSQALWPREKATDQSSSNFFFLH